MLSPNDLATLQGISDSLQAVIDDAANLSAGDVLARLLEIDDTMMLPLLDELAAHSRPTAV